MHSSIQPGFPFVEPALTSDAEERLSGGRLTAGVVRVGQTVRRPQQPSSPWVARLLLHLEGVGYAGAPRYLGVDAAGRDVLSFLDGWVPAKFQAFADFQVHEAAVLLRSLHDATRTAGWAGVGQVVCHHDPGPNNAVFRGDRPVAWIDFDTAAPGFPLDDIGYAAWTWCVSSRSDRGPAVHQAHQVRVFVEGYGLSAADRAGVVDAMLSRQEANVLFWKQRLDSDSALSGAQQCPDRATLQKRVGWSERELAFTRENAAVFRRFLDQPSVFLPARPKPR